MTELEHVEIEGFKGLEYVEFEPTDINLITGRNNTGKTSFLEAVDLLFNPRTMDEFGTNATSLINVGYDYSEIQGRTSKSEIIVTVRQPSIEETEQYISEMILESISISGDPQEGPIELEEREDEIRGVARQAIEEISTRELFEELQSEILMLCSRGEKHSYFLGGSATKNIIGEVAEEISNELDPDASIYTGRNKHSKLINLSSGDLVFGTSRGSFLSKPEDAKPSNFIKSKKVVRSIERTDDEQEPIKIDNIGDFIKEKKLVDDLKTFTLDYLVFEDEDGEKEQVPYEFMGDGFKTMVGLLWELMDENVENGIVLLEEPETHMHPGYVREMVYFLIDLAREEDVQLFITTHDSDFINDFFTENLTDEEEEYLEDEFSLLRMEEDSAVVEDYETARENLKDLHLDLRGI